MPRMKATKLFKDLLTGDSEKAGGLVLTACTILSLLLANSNFGTNYHDFFQTQFAGHSFEHWISDSVMGSHLNLGQTSFTNGHTVAFLGRHF